MLLEKEVDNVVAKEATSSDNNHIWECGFGGHLAELGCSGEVGALNCKNSSSGNI